MKLANYLVLLFVITISALCAQNQMALMNTIYGEFNGDEFGADMVAMDYNGDGYDDLIVVATFWNATNVLGVYYPGKLYFYWGGPNGLSNTPGFVIEGQSHRQIAPDMVNAGDMNGDGIDDLAITYSTDIIQQGMYKSIAIYLGRANPQSAPDFLGTIPYTSVIPVYLGDINGDGKSDLAFWGYHRYHRYSYFAYIWTDLESDPIHFLDSGVDSPIYLGGVGDVNNDGYDDAYMAFPYNISTFWATLRYGNASASLSDSLLLTASFVDGWPRCSPLGDINGDGFSDFMGYTIWPNHFLWLGSPELDSIPDLTLNLDSPDHDMSSFRRSDTKYAVYGDLNGDGYDDFVCSDPYVNGYNGQAGLWLGSPDVNATVDLVFNPPSDWQWRNFGHAKAVGDFNGDSYDDLALSCPRWMDGGFHFPGRIYIFAGNVQLEDTTVANDDPVAPSVSIEDWRINIYPNPCHRGIEIVSVDLRGESFSKEGHYSYGLFNIRGQKIQEGLISSEDLSKKNFDIAIHGLSSGIYQVTVLLDRDIKYVKRIVIY